MREYTVFGRVTPNQKRKLVRALQRQGHTVAMTGDGVNDVLALKDADCGIAMASGSDAACHAAQLVLLNSDFSAMPKVVAEGRRVINNIQRAAALYLVKNIFSFLLALISLFATFPYPVTPLLLPGPGAQSQPGKGQVPVQRVPRRPARGTDRPVRGAGGGDLLPHLRLQRGGAVHHVGDPPHRHRYHGTL